MTWKNGMALCTVFCLAAGAANAQVTSINGFVSNTRNFNDFGGSTLSSSANYAAGTLTVSESNFGGPGNFANRHRYFFSADGGATAYALNNQDYFDLEFDLNLNVNNMNLAEAGFYSETFVGGEPRFIAKANDAVFAFDSWLPFVFGGGYGNNVTTRMRMIYNPGSGSGGIQSEAATCSFYRDGNLLATVQAGNFNSPDFVNGYFTGSWFGFYAQFSPKKDVNGVALPDASATLTISNITLVPAPGALALVGFAGLAAARRRR